MLALEQKSNAGVQVASATHSKVGVHPMFRPHMRLAQTAIMKTSESME